MRGALWVDRVMALMGKLNGMFLSHPSIGWLEGTIGRENHKIFFYKTIVRMMSLPRSRLWLERGDAMLPPFFD
jgi:hypothetical protein